MVDRLLRVHIPSQRAFGPWLTLSYNICIKCSCSVALKMHISSINAYIVMMLRAVTIVPSLKRMSLEEVLSIKY